MNRNTERLVLLLLLLSYLAQGMVNIRNASLTFDEGPHLAVGYTTLRTGDFRLQPVHIHPPLANLISAAPLLLQDDLPDPTEINGWQANSLSAITDTVIWKYPHPARIATAGRTPMLLVGVLLATLVYKWARIMGGQFAGLLAVLFYAFDPNIIAHSSLITTDIVVTLLSTATLLTTTLYLFSSANRKRQPVYLILTGVLLGLTQLSKVSALALIPVVALSIFITSVIRRQKILPAIIHTAFILTAILGIGFLVLWAGYGFQISQPSGGTFPLPASTHWEIYASLSQHYQLGHPAFALGKINSHGWWWYFPLAFLIKTPIPSLLFVFTSVTSGAIHLWKKRKWRSDVFKSKHIVLISWVILYGISSLFSSVNIGYRHLLPLLPCLYIYSGYILSKIRIRSWKLSSVKQGWASRILAWCFIVSIAWLVIGTIPGTPSSLEYFNEFAGGSQGGYHFLVDSNIDWGQNLWDLYRWMEKSNVEQVKYAHYSPASPHQYGIKVDFLPPDPRAIKYTPWDPEPGMYVIGATVLQGVYTSDINTYAYFRSKTPLKRLGNALFVYEIEEREKPAWVVSCSLEPSPEVIRKALSNSDLRVINLDCLSAQVYPTNTGPGLYLVPPNTKLDPQGFHDFDLKQHNGDIWRQVYRVDDQPKPNIPAIHRPNIDGPLTFLGYTLDNNSLELDSALTLTTYWQVAELASRPLSILAQLVSPGSPALSVGDGLGFPIEAWSLGDVIAQKHVLQIAETETHYDNVTLITGGYWLDTMERWATQHIDNVIVLTELSVR